MGAIAGLVNLIPGTVELENIKNTMKRRGPLGFEQIAFGQSIFLHSISKSGHSGYLETEQLVLIWSGEIYNKRELCSGLRISEGTAGSAELILSAYQKWGKDFLGWLNGVFSIAILEKKSGKLLLARDPMGIRPLFYREQEGGLLFASEIKTLLACPHVEAELDRQGAMELILLGPGRKPGSGVLKGIRELEPGCCCFYEHGRIRTIRYFSLQDRYHEESFEETAENIRFLLSDAVKRQTAGIDDYGTFLSGGLDSSILSAMAAERLGEKPLKTYSVSYLHNDRYFEPGKFLPESDDAYIEEMTEFLHSCHQKTILTPEDLLKELEEATLARDLPGMGDVDFSLLAFCKETVKTVPMVLSGECADEIFGGYPWYRDPSVQASAGFPWAQNTALRKSLMVHAPEDAEDFVREAFQETICQSDILPENSPEDRRIKELVNLNMRWFMQTLVDRNDRMSSAAGLEVRVPFCDVRIARYLYGVPWHMKDHEGREKGLLRYAVKGILPESVRLRRKSPYPKTFDPRYGDMVKKFLLDLLTEDAPIWYLVSRQTVIHMMEQDAENPWYGQLMRFPQFAAWLLQIDFWLKYYNIHLIL